MTTLRQRNRSYWDDQARDDSRWHIAHSTNEDDFVASGARDAVKLFGDGLTLLPSAGRVLDVGCGIGRVLGQLALARPDLTLFGVDVSPEMVRTANERLAEHGRVIVLRTAGDGLDAFDDGYFELVYSIMVFQHLPRSVFEAYLGEIARVLRPGGCLRLQVQYDRASNGADPHAADDFRSIRYYDLASLEALAPPSLSFVDAPAPPSRDRVHDYYVTARKEA